MKKALRVAAALAALALLVVTVIHTSPVRRYVLGRAIAMLQEQLQIRIEAETLSYNLFTLRASLGGVSVAAEGSADAPFFTARRLTIEVPQSAVLGPLTIESIEIDDGRIRIVREADGRTNLPGGGDEAGEPGPLLFGVFVARRLAIEAIDRESGSSLILPAVDLTVSAKTGRIDLLEPGRLTRGGVSTEVKRLQGGVTFDGRIVRLSQIEMQTSELTATADGRLALLVAEPSLDAQLDARGEMAALARWAELADPPHGSILVRGDVAGPLTALTAALTFTSERLAWRDVTLTDVAGSARVMSDRVDVERLDARVAGGRVAASGVVPFGDEDTRLALSWDAVDLESLASLAGSSSALRPTGRASGSLEAHGPAGNLPLWVVTGQTRIGGGRNARNRVAVAGQLNVIVKRDGWALSNREPMIVAGLQVRPTLSGRIDYEAFERSTIDGVVELFETPIQRVVDAIVQTGIAALDTPPLDGTVQAQATVSGRVGQPVLRLNGAAEIAEVATLAPGTPIGGRLHVGFESDLRTAHLTASLSDLNALAEGDVTLRAPYAANLKVVVAELALERALRGIETPVPVSGTFSATAHGAGDLEAWRNGRVDVEIASFDALAGALAVRLAEAARVSVVGQVVDVASLHALAGEVRVSATGRLPVRTDAAAVRDAEALQITATGDLAQVLNAVAATGAVALPDVSGTGPAALLARVTGSVQTPQVSADLELGPGTLQAQDLPPATNVTLRLHSDGRWVELRDLRAEWQGSTIGAEGRVPVRFEDARGERAELTARLTSVTPQVLAPFIDADTLSQLEGSVDATLSLQSPSFELSGVSGELRLDRMEMRIADLPVAQREPTRIAIRDGFAQVEAWQWTGQGGSAGVQGRVRLSDRQAALLADGRFDLRMLTPFTRAAGITLSGMFEPRLSITGALDAPRINGTAAIVEGEMRLADPRVIATGLSGRLVLTGGGAQLTSMTGTVNGGTMTARGAVEYRPPEPLEATLAVEIGGMAIEFPEGLRSELDAKLGLSVTVPAADVMQPSGRIDGTVTVVRSSYREPIAVAAGLLGALQTRRLAADALAGEPSLFDNLVLDIRVLTEDDLIVDNNVGRLMLGADLRVIGTVAAPSLSGRAQLREGGQLFLGRNRYEIESGTIDFANPVTIEPELNVSATTRAGGEDISLTIKGTADQPELDLRSTSDPDLGQADVASLLLTGRRLDQISGDEAEIVGEQALAYLSGDLLGFASRAVGLDTIRLGGIDETARSGDPSTIATQVDPTARLTFGKSIGRDLDVVFSQGLRNADAQTWIIDYRPRRQVEARFVSDDDNLRSYEFRHDVSFGGVSLADSGAAARPPRQRQRIAAVTITGAAVVAEERLRGAIELEPGDELDFAEWQRDIDRLEALLRREGFYEARVTARRDGEGDVSLNYAIAEGPRSAIDITGYAFDDPTIAAIRQAWVESVFDEFLVEEAGAIARARLLRDGYVRPEVLASIAVEGGRKTLSLRIDPGSRIDARSVRFGGVEAPLEGALTEWAATRPAATQAMEDPAAFARTLTAWLRARGHLRASVTVAPPSVEAGEAIVPVRVNAGPVFLISDVTVQHATSSASPEEIEPLGVTVGAPFDPVAVDAAGDRLQARYRLEGFSSARVEFRPTIDERVHAVAITFLVTEGPRQVIRSVEVAGNRAIDTDVVTRALGLQVGEPAGANEWLQARRRVFDTGLFRRVDVTPEPMERAPGGSEQPMRARVTVQEWPALRLRYGFEVAEERPEGEVEGRELVPGLSADITRRTIFGRAVTLGAAVSYQRRERGARGFISAPTLFGRPIESSFLVERSREEFTAVTLVTDVSAASWEQRVRVTPRLRLSYAYRFERNRTFDTAALPDDEFAFDLTVNIAALNGTAAWDTRDDVADTSRGWLLSSSMDWAPAGLGTDFRFLRYLGQAYYFRPWGRVVMASAARVGLAAPLGGQDLVPSERFLAGGSRTVRGVGDDTLGPRDALGDPAGGESLLVFNQEVRVPLYRWLRGVGFVDAGNVFADTSGIDAGDLVGSYGVGLRLATPFAMFRVDYGRLFSPRQGEQPGRWIFGIGQTF